MKYIMNDHIYNEMYIYIYTYMYINLEKMYRIICFCLCFSSSTSSPRPSSCFRCLINTVILREADKAWHFYGSLGRFIWLNDLRLGLAEQPRHWRGETYAKKNKKQNPNKTKRPIRNRCSRFKFTGRPLCGVLAKSETECRSIRHRNAQCNNNLTAEDTIKTVNF